MCCLASERQPKNTRFQFLMCYLLISMHCITCYTALDRLSCCKCLLVYVTFNHTHWSVDGPRIAPKVLTEHLDFKAFPGGGGGGAGPQPPPSLCHIIYGLTGFYLGATALSCMQYLTYMPCMDPHIGPMLLPTLCQQKLHNDMLNKALRIKLCGLHYMVPYCVVYMYYVFHCNIAHSCACINMNFIEPYCFVTQGRRAGCFDPEVFVNCLQNTALKAVGKDLQVKLRYCSLNFMLKLDLRCNWCVLAIVPGCIAQYISGCTCNQWPEIYCHLQLC